MAGPRRDKRPQRQDVGQAHMKDRTARVSSLVDLYRPGGHGGAATLSAANDHAAGAAEGPVLRAHWAHRCDAWKHIDLTCRPATRAASRRRRFAGDAPEGLERRGPVVLHLVGMPDRAAHGHVAFQTRRIAESPPLPAVRSRQAIAGPSHLATGWRGAGGSGPVCDLR
jgi:hypothetical protein